MENDSIHSSLYSSVKGYILLNIFTIDGDSNFLRFRHVLSQTTVKVIYHFECTDPTLILLS